MFVSSTFLAAVVFVVFLFVYYTTRRVTRRSHAVFRRLKPGDVSETEVRFQSLPRKFAPVPCQSKFAS